MVVNGSRLLSAKPIEAPADSKQRGKMVSWGLTEAGYDIRIRETLTFSAGNRFQLASSLERFTMPSWLVAIVHDKSTWARQGLSVFNTVIEPGWEGYLTLELVYHGDSELTIEAGEGIAQVLFHEVEIGADYRGRYQGQGPQAIPAIALLSDSPL